MVWFEEWMSGRSWWHAGVRLMAVSLCLGVLGMSAARADDQFLPPEQVFQATAEALDAGTVEVRFSIRGGYYLYRDRLQFASQTPGITLGEPQFPPSRIKHDKYFGDVGVYHRQAVVRVPLQRTAPAGTLALEVGMQGCADAGFCYPPMRQTLTVSLPAAAASPAAAQPAEVEPESGPVRSVSALRATLGLDRFPASEDELQNAEDAFRLQVAIADPDRLHVQWEIAPGSYLEKKSIRIALEGVEGVALGPIDWPAAQIEHDVALPGGSTGDLEVYENRLDLPLVLHGQALAGTPATLVVNYQGCSQTTGICYPPQTKRLHLTLPALSGTTAPQRGISPVSPVSAAVSDNPAMRSVSSDSEQDRIAAVLFSGNLWAILPLFFGFGLLLAFTPCIFPMIPILSGIIVGQGGQMTTRRAFVLSLVYVLSMAVTYTVIGLLAGLFGANLQAVFQNPWILSAFAAVFVLLALSMFGFYDLQLPASLQTKLAHLSNRQHSGTLLGVAIMGLLSALIVGPCVAPPLFGALIYIGQTGDAILGAAALFALGLGMGMPLLVLGASAGKLLPRAGNWMYAVKAVFGVGLLGVAIVLLERILPAGVTLFLWAVLAICSAVYMGALSLLPAEAGGWHKLRKGLGVVLLVYGILLLCGVALGGQDPLRPLHGVSRAQEGQAAARVQFTPVRTVADLEREVAAAQARGEPVMLDFTADWCVSCREMERYTFSDPDVIAEMRHFTLLRADVTANDAEDRALMEGRFGIPGPPALVFFDAQGQEHRGWRRVGFIPAAAFAAHLREVLQ